MLRLFLLAALLVLQACTARKTLAGWGQAFYYVQADGQVYSFGRNVAGELGIGSTYDSRFPKQMLNVLFAMDAAAGSEFACVVDEGAAKCVGRSVEGQLGNGNETLPLSNKLVQVHGLNSGVDEVYTGHAHACARLTNGGAMCWGHNIFGALADNSQTTRLSPVAVVGFESGGVRDMALGSYNTCLLTLAGKVLCVGPNSYGQFDADSVGSYVLTMSPIIGLENNIRYVSISCGSGHTCVVNEVGETYCIGSNHYGQLGVAGHSGTGVPIRPIGLGLVSFVWLSHSSSFFTSQGNGSVWACGFNQKGVLGLGDTKNRPTPAVFGNGKPMIKQIRGGWRTTCVLDHSDAIQCVGDGEHGQLGRGNFEDSLVLVDVIFQAKMFHAMTPSSVLWDCVPLTAIMIAGLLCFKCWLRGTNKAISKPLLSPADRDDNGGES